MRLELTQKLHPLHHADLPHCVVPNGLSKRAPKAAEICGPHALSSRGANTMTSENPIPHPDAGGKGWGARAASLVSLRPAPFRRAFASGARTRGLSWVLNRTLWKGRDP